MAARTHGYTFNEVNSFWGHETYADTKLVKPLPDPEKLHYSDMEELNDLCDTVARGILAAAPDRAADCQAAFKKTDGYRQELATSRAARWRRPFAPKNRNAQCDAFLNQFGPRGLESLRLQGLLRVRLPTPASYRRS